MVAHLFMNNRETMRPFTWSLNGELFFASLDVLFKKQAYHNNQLLACCQSSVLDEPPTHNGHNPGDVFFPAAESPAHLKPPHLVGLCKYSSFFKLLFYFLSSSTNHVCLYQHVRCYCLCLGSFWNQPNFGC